jgi:hypothetical protein
MRACTPPRSKRALSRGGSSLPRPLWFDVEWRLYNDVNNTLRHVETVVVRVTLKESPSRAFEVVIL